MAKGKTLFVSDFDDTLAQTDAMITVTNNGKQRQMDPAEFAIYEPQEGDQFDFSEFEQLINPRPIERFVKLLKNAIGRADKIAVLTARGHTRPVAQFLKMHGIESGVSIAAIGSGDPEKKASYIRKHIQAGFDRVAFIDDSPKNIDAVKRLRAEFPQAKILAHQAKEHEAPIKSDEPDDKKSTESPDETNAVSQQAQQMGLIDLKFGRWGKKIRGRLQVTHTVQNGRLIPKQTNQS